MIARQDIDALLISALYGELTPAEEARLTAHLESHPADRTALADLTHARNAIRESRILTVQLDPPQSITAMLMQEAARRAPRQQESEGWFARLARSFLSHPAMAAAAMLVLVIGVAGTMYMKGAAKVAQPSLPAAEQELARDTANADQLRQQLGSAPAPVVAAAPAVPEPPKPSDDLAKEQTAVPATGSVAQGSAYRVDLDDGYGNEATKNKLAKAYAAKGEADSKAEHAAPASHGEAAFERAAAPTPQKKAGSYVELRKPEPAPKDLPDRARDQQVTASLDGANGLDEGLASRHTVGRGATPTAPSGAAGGAAAGPGAPAAQPPPPPAAPTASPAKADSADRAERQDSALVAWAKQQRERVVGAVRANNCQGAASLAMEIYRRAPDYFNANIVTDIEVKPCMAYLNSDRDKDVERRASKQAAPAPTSERK